MTSSLPNFAPAPAPAGAVSPGSPGLAGFGAIISPATTGDFADLMSEQDAATDCPEMATAMPSFTILAPTLISLLSAPAEALADVAAIAALPATAATAATVAADEAAPTAGGPTRDNMEQAASFLATILQSVLPEAAAPVVQTGLANTAPTTVARRDASLPLGETLEGTRPWVPGSTDLTIFAPTLISLLASPVEVPADVAAIAAVPATPAAVAADEAAPTAGGITRDIMEQAASVLATILQSVLPEAAAPVVSTGFANAAPTTAARRDASLPVGEAFEGTRPCVPGSTDGAELAAPASASEIAITSWDFEANLAADGAVEIKAKAPKEQGSGNQTAPSRSGAFEIEAEIALPGRAVMRLSAATPAADEPQAKAKFAGRISATGSALNSPNGAVEINFLSSGNKEVVAALPESGIAVAKPASTMSTPTEETRASSDTDTMSDVAAHGQFTVAWPSVDRSRDALIAPVEKNFAERAVATVSALVDTQFTASMQKSGSVQLRLKCGGEDVNVRVELRGGAVHTDFRTDSPELRAALNREWQAVASQSSESLRRFVDPVFAPASSSGGDTFSSRQQATQQDLSQQSRHPRAREDETVTVTRRSFGADIFSPQPAAPRAPAYVSTSHRLSVLA